MSESFMLAEVVASVFYISALVTIFEIGLQCFMTIFGLFLYLQSTTEQRRGRLPYIVVSFAILFISSFSAGLDALVTFRSLYTSAGPQDYIRIITILENGWHRVASTFCANAYVLIGDAVLLYRCYVIWMDKRWVMAVPTLTYLSTTAVTFSTAVLSIKQSTLGPMPESAIHTYRNLTTAFIFLTVALNIILTSLISFRLLRAHKQIASVLPDRDMSYVYKNVITILVEAALPLTLTGLGYALVEVVRLAIFWKNRPETMELVRAAYAFAILYYAFAALSPQMIIFRVTTGRSWMRHEEARSAAPSGHPSQPLRFNHALAGDPTSFASSLVAGSRGSHANDASEPSLAGKPT
ncbi:hypothetical protein CC1G_05773 [Coprinopsis cinerea okayama7|uniref:Uncharacterized protein n=1 Tax=Coprinopsis cinerea (strain Okayama-7 / 130 / ATCC MYA-4618 / FGSC 9003) TaxID=240176 RepID=A8NL97_COPC7|nr:hypothetical protein CC1G_05773 [Coprinopsis cinerea okayama7\|eukprot:XP_001834636.1 hypothetical protein CC1G_05773 [Coprinopsis cinerea okayama7\